MIFLTALHEGFQLWVIDALGAALVLVIGFVGADFSKQIKGLRKDFQSSQVHDAETRSDVRSLIESNKELWETINIIRKEIGGLREGATERGILIDKLESKTDEFKMDLKEVRHVQDRCINCNENKRK